MVSRLYGYVRFYAKLIMNIVLDENNVLWTLIRMFYSMSILFFISSSRILARSAFFTFTNIVTGLPVATPGISGFGMHTNWTQLFRLPNSSDY